MRIKEFNNYITYEKKYAKHTCKAYLSDLEQFESFLVTQYNIIYDNQITTQMVRSWVVSLVDKGTSINSIHRKISSLKSYFNYLLKKEYVNSSPVRKIILPKKKKKSVAAIEQTQMEHLLERINFEEGYEGIRNKTILELFYHTGIRSAELIGLTVGDIDNSEGYIKVLGKGNKERIIPTSPYLLKELQHYIQVRNTEFGTDNKALFLTAKGNSIYPKLVYNIVNKYLATITSLEQKSPHTLRHTFATHLAEEGADLNAIKKLMGHASLASTQLYTHNTITRLKEVYKQAHPKSTKTSN